MPTELKTKIRDKQISLRKQLWPDVKEEELWFHAKNDGFIAIPRVMPLVLKIMDKLASRPVSSTYIDLWCRKWDEQFITINRPLTEYAFFAGFAQQRGVQTWKERIRELQRLGFIKVEGGSYGEISYVLIVHPVKIIESHATKKTANLNRDYLNALRDRATQVGKKHLQHEQEEELQKPSRKAA